MISQDLIDKVKNSAKLAGDEILKVYEGEIEVEHKDDKSPLTEADKRSHLKIMEFLKDSEYPVLSEEGKEIEYAERKGWTTFWCVDPLDGTKEFINRNGQFTVNIALIHEGYPVLGVIYVPVTEEFFYGAEGFGSFTHKLGETPQKMEVNKKASDRIAVKSKSHGASEEDELFAKYGVTDTIAVGSSLKFCMVAVGKADIYYRHGPTMEWDTAAGQAVVEYAGGTVNTLEEQRFFYNKEVLRNGSFLVKGF